MKSLSSEITPKISSGLKLSLAGHLGLLLFVLFKSIVFPSKTVPYVPTLKVDLVALPDTLKKDLKNPNQQQFNQDISRLLRRVEQEAKRTESQESQKQAKKNLPKTDEMVLQPKAQNDRAVENKNKRALDRIKALAKIQNSEDALSSSQKPVPIKGNKLSPGTSLSGEAREALEANYFDIVRDRLQENWTLPAWISRQNLAAQVQLYIDNQGRLHDFKFLKVSGNPQFDDAIKKTLQDSAPFPPPPHDLVSSLLSNGILVGFPL